MRLAALSLLLFACGHSPQPNFYTLAAHDGRTRNDVAGVIEVRTPHVASYLDRNELVLGVSGQRLELARNAEWAEPLGVMLGRILATDLAQRLPQASVLTESGELRTQARLHVELEVRRFERAGSELVLDTLVVVRSEGRELLRSVALRSNVSNDATDLVRGMSEQTAQLADQIANLVAELSTTPR